MMLREQTRQIKKQLNAPVRKNPRTIEERIRARDEFTFSKKYGTLRCRKKGTEIKEAHFGSPRPGVAARHYKVPFTREQAEEICHEFNHGFRM